MSSNCFRNYFQNQSLKLKEFLTISLQDKVLLLQMSVVAIQAPPAYLFSGMKFQLHIKMVLYCITQLPTER